MRSSALSALALAFGVLFAAHVPVQAAPAALSDDAGGLSPSAQVGPRLAPRPPTRVRKGPRAVAPRVAPRPPRPGRVVRLRP